MPAHTHSTQRFQETGTGLRGGGSGVIYSNVARTSGSTGGNLYHENRPPYYALAFIMRVS